MQPPRETRAFEPLPFVALVAVGAVVPLLSTFATVLIVVALAQAVSGGSAASIQQWLSQPEGHDASADLAIETSGLVLEMTILASTVLLATWRDPRQAPLQLGWAAWSKDRSLLPFLALLIAWKALDELLIEPATPAVALFRQMPATTPALLVSLAAATIAAPLAEELLFRGFLYTNLRAQAPAIPTIAITALLNAFMRVEISPAMGFSLLPLALICGAARERYRSVRPAIYLHVIAAAIAWGGVYFGATPP